MGTGDAVLLLDEVEQHWAAGRRVVCEVQGTCDLGVVDTLSRLALRAGRRGAELRVRAMTQDTRRLLELAGLTAVLHVEVRGPSPPPQC